MEYKCAHKITILQNTTMVVQSGCVVVLHLLVGNGSVLRLSGWGKVVGNLDGWTFFILMGCVVLAGGWVPFSVGGLVGGRWSAMVVCCLMWRVGFCEGEMWCVGEQWSLQLS
jgi:hypothetical protein